MRPPLVSDDLIRAAIREVAGSSERITGVAVRAVLARRHGARGGVTRIYRLVRDAQRPVPEAPLRARLATGNPESHDAAIERANLAEHREQAHQARWARETDELRARLADAERGAGEVAEARRRIAELARALASAQARITSLEATLEGRPS